MNKAYRIIWSRAIGCWKIVSEHARSSGKGAFGSRSRLLFAVSRFLSIVIASGMLLCPVPNAYAQYAAGTGTAGTNSVAIGTSEGSSRLPACRPVAWQFGRRGFRGWARLNHDGLPTRAFGRGASLP